MATLDESGAVVEDQPAGNVFPLRPEPGKAEKPKRARRAMPKRDDALGAVVDAGAQAAQQADAAVSNAVAAGADAVDAAQGAVTAGVQAVNASVTAAGAVGNFAKWVVIGLLAWMVFGSAED